MQTRQHFIKPLRPFLLVFWAALALTPSFGQGKYIKNPGKDFRFKLCPNPVSTKDDETAVTLAGSDQKIVVHVDRNGSLFNKQFERSENGWTASTSPAGFNAINSGQQPGAGSFNRHVDIFYFSKKDTVAGNSRLYRSTLKDGVWQTPALVKLEYIDGPYHYQDPATTPGGDTLVFSADIPGGMGGYDLWYVARDLDGNWGIIQNMGEAINTAFDEKTPFYFPKAHSLFFSSKGHVGYGGFDVFFIQQPFGGQEIVNIGAPFNSAYDDQSLVLGGKFGYLSSDRPGGNGGFDIYSFLSESVGPRELANNGALPDAKNANASEDILKSSKIQDTGITMSASLSSPPDLEMAFGLEGNALQSGNGQVETALTYYQNLSGSQKKFADRIIALRNVNELYLFHPGLSANDGQYYQSLPQADKLKIQHLARFFDYGYSLSDAEKSQDLAYLESLDGAKLDRVLRLAVRVGLGMDKEHNVAFSDADWELYKKLPEGEIAQMKTVAKVLKDNKQAFSVSLAAGYLENNPSQPVLAQYAPKMEKPEITRERQPAKTVATKEQSTPAQGQPADNAQKTVENPGGNGTGTFSISMGNSQPTDQNVYHVVKKGESLRSIARQYGKKPRALKELNNIRGNRLKPGIKLLVEKRP